MAKVKQKRAGKCTPKQIEKICILYAQGHTWTDIAKIIEVNRDSLRNWRNPKSEYYNEDLVKALAKVDENKNCDKMKADQHRQSQFHYLKKNIRDLREVDIRTLWPIPKDYKLPKGAKRLPGRNKFPPPMPPMSYTKADIVDYAALFLDLKLDGRKRKGQLRNACQKRLIDLTVEIMITVRNENQECEPNQQAVKNVGTNCGPENERWKFKQEIEHEVTPKSIADIAAAVGVGSDSG